jgi:error-prone DNA polymerase
VAALTRLAEADAFRPSLGLARREALWAIKALADAPLALFAAADAEVETPAPEEVEPKVELRPMPAGGEVVEDYRHVSLTLRSHPMLLLRPVLNRRKLARAADLDRVPNGRWVRYAGIVTIRQQPETAKGTVFISLEDETGNVQVIVWRSLKELQRPEVLRARLLAVYGQWQRDGDVKNLIAHKLADLTPLLGGLATTSRDFQ